MTDCAKCGETHLRCRAHNKAGRPCGIWPADGATVCDRFHGGRAPQVKGKAVERVQRAQVLVALDAFRGVDAPDHVDPIAALLRLFRGVVMEVEYLRAQVAALDEDSQAGPGGGRRVHVLWEIYQDRSKFMADMVVAMGRLGIEERRVRIEEERAGEMAEVLGAALDALELGPEQRRIALTAMAAKLAGS